MGAPGMEAELREAIARDQLRLYYLPVYSLADGTIGSVEALLRWDSPDRGIVAPAEFISALEKSGLIVELGGWGIEEACRQLTRWRANLEQAELYVAVNISAPQLEDGVTEKIQDAAARTGAPLSRLAPEIEADDLANAPLQTVQSLAPLEELGARMVVDGIAGDNVPLDRLRAVPVRALRIAAAVVTGLPDDARCTDLARDTIAVGEELGVEVIAQHVETPGQLAALRKLRCGSASGFLFALPRPADLLENTLRGRVRPAASPPDAEA